MDITSDQQLVEESLNGNSESFERLLKKYLHPTYNFLFQLVPDKSTVDDLAQETFIKAWKNLSHFDRTKNFKAWLFTIAKNTAYDFLKKKKTIPFSNFLDEEGNSLLEEISNDNFLPDKILERNDLTQILESKLQEVPKVYRLILTMHYQEDLSLQEIAQILQKPYNTIKSQHTRALSSLRSAFNKA